MRIYLSENIIERQEIRTKKITVANATRIKGSLHFYADQMKLYQSYFLMRDVVEFDFARGSNFSLFVSFLFGCQLSCFSLEFKSLWAYLMPLGIIEQKEVCSLGFCTKVWVP